MNERLKIIDLGANHEMVENVAKLLNVKIVPTTISRYADGEIMFSCDESVRGDNVYIIQSTYSPVSDHLMELLLCVDACRRASAKEINCVVPYFGYSRQDRKTKPRQPISAKLVAQMIEIAGADRVISSDLHSAQIAGFFKIPVDDISPTSIFIEYFKKIGLKDIVCVSPDHGGMRRTGAFAEKLNAKIAIIDKRRPEPNKAELFSIVGDVKGKDCIIVDDIVDTAGTLLLAVDKLYELGARNVYAAVTHGVLSKDAVERIEKSQLKKLVISDSIPLSKEKKSTKIDVVSLAPLLSQILLTLEKGESVAKSLENFEKRQ